MQIEIFLALVVFAFTTSITPGPNNMMLFASGVNFGFVRTIPHMCGIGVGFLVLLLAVGFGLGALLETVPGLYTLLKFTGGAYLLWIAWKIGTSRLKPTVSMFAMLLAITSSRCCWAWAPSAEMYMP